MNFHREDKPFEFIARACPLVEYRRLILEGEPLVNFKGVLDQLKP